MSAREDPYPRFSAAEYDRRIGRLLELADDARVEALIVHGSGNARSELQYLTAWPPRWDSFLIVGGGRPPALRVQLFNHVPNAREMAVVEDVEFAGPDPAATVSREVRQRGRVRRAGLIGAVPYQLYGRLAAQLDGVELVDLTRDFRRGRLIKSDEEIEWTRRGAAMCDAAIEWLVEQARPGMTEHELGAIVEGAYAPSGGQTGICFIATAPMSGGGRLVPAQNLSQRRVAAGDAIMIELSAGIGGYTGQVLRTIAVGEEPPDQLRRLHDLAEQAFAAIVAALRPGVSASELLRIAGMIDDAGCTVVDDVVHGYGGGYLPPVLRTPATQHGPAPGLVLEAGMFIVVQPNVVAGDGSLGVQTGELVMVTAAGAESLHTAARGLLRTGPAAAD